MEDLNRVLVLNCGSSGLKWSLLAAGGALVDGGEAAWGGSAEAPEVPAVPTEALVGTSGAAARAVRAVVRRLPPFSVVGHRFVQGGAALRETVRIDPAVREELAVAAELDPLHMRPALAAVDALEDEAPHIPQVAVFDTTLHQTMPIAASTYALPHEWTDRWDLRRTGFHGLSVTWAIRRSAELLQAPPARLIVCHLGSGCSVTAVRDGRCVDTTMGFTPLEGLVMATRSGSIDPGLLLHLQIRHGLSARELFDALNTRSGLLGVSGISGDVRDVLAAADEGLARPLLAYGQFIRSIHLALGGMAAVLGGVDALVFTGGIGSHLARVRTDAAAGLQFAGVHLNEHANREANVDADIARHGAAVRVLVIRAREDLIILDEVLRSHVPIPPLPVA